jgi:hypothetical protein
MVTMPAPSRPYSDDALPRRLGIWMLIGLIILPWVTVWLTYRQGYTIRTRVAATLWFSLHLWAISGGGPSLDAYAHAHHWW